MSDIKRKWDLISKEKRKDAIDAIIEFFQNERDEEIGLIGAEEVLDCVLEEVALEIYKIGVEDSKKLITKKLEDLSIDLDVLMDK
jgi:uncharacterized protein (DUF2164 family)